MTAKKGLQKLTEFEKKVKTIIELERISLDDLDSLSITEKNELISMLAQKMFKKEHEEKDLIYSQIEGIISEDLKNQIWEVNHAGIIWEITTKINETGRLPTVMELSIKTKLSRQTIYKHLKSFANHPIQLAYMDQCKLMCNKVLSVVCKLALAGDVSAAKLFLNCMNSTGNQSINKTIIQNQNNYVQVNELVLSQDTIKKMSAEQLEIIEKIVLSV